MAGTKTHRVQFRCHSCEKGRGQGLSGVTSGWVIVLDSGVYVHVCKKCQDKMGVPSLSLVETEFDGS